MKTDDAVKHYLSKSAVARESGVSRQSVNSWRGTVPYERAVVLHTKSGGKIPLRKNDYRPRMLRV